MVEDLTLWSSAHTDSAFRVRNARGSSLLGLTAGFSDAQFDCLTWILRHAALIRFVHRYDIAIDPLIWHIRAVAVLFLALLWAICWSWLGALHTRLCEYAFYESAVVNACMCTELCACVCMHMQHVRLCVGVCLWERLQTPRRYCWIYPRTSSVLWVSLRCGAHCQIDRPILKNSTLGRICSELMKPRSSHIKSNISTCLAVA